MGRRLFSPFLSIVRNFRKGIPSGWDGDSLFGFCCCRYYKSERVSNPDGTETFEIFLNIDDLVRKGIPSGWDGDVRLLTYSLSLSERVSHPDGTEKIGSVPQRYQYRPKGYPIRMGRRHFVDSPQL